MMTLYDFVDNYSGSYKLKLILDKWDTDDEIVLFDDNVACIFVERPDLLSYRVGSIHAYPLDNPIPYHIDEDFNRYCTDEIIIHVYKPTILSRISCFVNRHIRWSDTVKNTIECALYDFKIDAKLWFFGLFNKWFLPFDFWEMNQLNDSSDDIPINRNNGNFRLFIYTKNIRMCSLIRRKYKFPIFRVWVINFDNDNIKSKYLGFVDWSSYYIDYTMVFTLEPHPKWLQDYDKIKKQLCGNIISKEEIQRHVDYVADNYEVFRAAWDTDTNMFGTYSCGYDVTKLTPIE